MPEELYCNAQVDELPTGEGVACGQLAEKIYKIKPGIPGHEDCTPESCEALRGLAFCDEHAQQFREQGLLDEGVTQ